MLRREPRDETVWEEEKTGEKGQREEGGPEKTGKGQTDWIGY